MELSVKKIYKSFGAGNVLDGVDFSVHGGEICALLGENGAGKSTLMNIVGGVLAQDSGNIYTDGKEVRFHSPAESLSSGIAFIHQELNLINDLTVYENIFLSALKTKGVVLDKKTMIQKTRELFENLRIGIDPCAYVKELDASYKQMVEIARSLMSQASVIIMDEPTASLTPSETEHIFEIMRTLKSRGVAMIFISHKLDEVMRICDRFTVLRNGVAVKSGNIADVTAKEIASYMVGHTIDFTKKHRIAEYKEEVLRVKDLSDKKNFHGISLSLHRGEILGVTGLLGNGQSEIFSSLFGVYGPAYTGDVCICGRSVRPSSEHEALKCGIAYLAKNRKENSIIPDMSILDNATLVALRSCRSFGILDKSKQKKTFSDHIKDMHAKISDEENPITSLSGGNQQKVILAKWLACNPSVLILDNPTQGVDVGAKEEIYSIIEDLASNGIGIVVLSSEAAEIIRICDRSIVLYHGRIAGEVSGNDMTEENMMILATGAGKEGDIHG